MHRDVSPAGKQMLFREWSSAIVAGLRALVPEVVVTQQGPGRVMIIHSGLTTTLVEDGAYWVRFGEGAGIPMASLYDACRRDSFTCGNFARSIAGYFDSKFAHVSND